jgi:hypothetical protein
VFQKDFSGLAGVGRDFRQPDDRLDRFYLAEERPDIVEAVTPPVLKQAGGFGRHLPVVRVRQASPPIYMTAEFIDNGPLEESIIHGGTGWASGYLYRQQHWKAHLIRLGREASRAHGTWSEEYGYHDCDFCLQGSASPWLSSPVKSSHCGDAIQPARVSDSCLKFSMKSVLPDRCAGHYRLSGRHSPRIGAARPGHPEGRLNNRGR